MRKIKNYIETMYRPSFLMLGAGLAVFSASLIYLSLLLRADLAAGESDIIYRYPKMLEDICMPLYILLPTTILTDLNERKKNTK